MILDAAPQHEQAGILTRAERIGAAGAGSPAEAVGLIVITRTITVERANQWSSVREPGRRGHDCGAPSFPRGRTSPTTR